MNIMHLLIYKCLINNGNYIVLGHTEELEHFQSLRFVGELPWISNQSQAQHSNIDFQVIQDTKVSEQHTECCDTFDNNDKVNLNEKHSATENKAEQVICKRKKNASAQRLAHANETPEQANYR